MADFVGFRLRVALAASVALGALIAVSDRADAQSVPSDDAPQAQAGQATQDSESGQTPQTSDIVVTGTHIRGAAPASPMISLTQQEIYDRGYNDLGDAVRAMPSNFNGGQNPTVAPQAGGRNNQNLNGSSSLNLRGLGPDATLTLLNGHRLSYDGVFQAVDISAIPLAAVDRLEIVPDGASALYGSDAVGGVANVILKRDFSGLDTSARLGGSTDGGNFQQEYSAVTGDRWGSGGVILTGDYSRSTAVTAGQRSYTDTLYPSAMLIPYMRDIHILASGHQQITDGVTFEADVLYNTRNSSVATPYSTTAPASQYGLTNDAMRVDGMKTSGMRDAALVGCHNSGSGGQAIEAQFSKSAKQRCEPQQARTNVWQARPASDDRARGSGFPSAGLAQW